MRKQYVWLIERKLNTSDEWFPVALIERGFHIFFNKKDALEECRVLRDSWSKYRPIKYVPEK